MEYRLGTTGLVVEAKQVDNYTAAAIASWCGGTVIEERDSIDDKKFYGVTVDTPEGRKRASTGMYVIKVNNRFYVQYRSAFERKYRPVVEPEPEVNPSGFADPFEGIR